MSETFELLKYTALDQVGRPARLPSSKCKISFDAGRRCVQVKSGSVRLFLSLDRLQAIHIAGGDEVTAVGKTIGRMALTGLGSTLIAKGTGVGSSLLDLSFRGAETNTLYSGVMVFRGATVLRFLLPGKTLKQIIELAPAGVTDVDANEKAQQFLDLVSRMEADGPKVIEEIGTTIAGLIRDSKGVLAQAETGLTFAERDNARQKLREIENNIAGGFELLRAMLFYYQVSVTEFLAKEKGISEDVISRYLDVNLAANEPSAKSATIPVARVSPAPKVNREQRRFPNLAVARLVHCAVRLALWMVMALASLVFVAYTFPNPPSSAVAVLLWLGGNLFLLGYLLRRGWKAASRDMASGTTHAKSAVTET